MEWLEDKTEAVGIWSGFEKEPAGNAWSAKGSIDAQTESLHISYRDRQQSPPSLSERRMSSGILPSLLRTATRTTSFRASAVVWARHASSGHSQESFEAFTARYVAFFNSAPDLFEVQRGLNNCFAHDLVPAPSVIEAAVRAARRVNDYATAVRIFEGIREKVENKAQYDQYVQELKPLRDELSISLKEELYSS